MAIQILTCIYYALQFIAQHQVHILTSCAVPLSVAMFLFGLEARPRAVVQQQPVMPPINLLIHCSDTSGKWAFEVKRIDGSL
jgi:hypothetical protein